MPETIEDIKVFCDNCGYKFNEAEQSVKSAYKGKDKKKKLCGTVCLTFGRQYCDERTCPIKIKERENVLI